jgi:two-component system sensor histidine kinase/response regulator
VSSPVIVNVDDHEPARYARSRLLRKAGFEVVDAATGGAALEAVKSARPDLVLLDVHLPDINGIEVCRRIKQHPDYSSVIVLQISASAISAPSATAALNAGADSYLIEPIDADVLVASIRALLRLRNAEQQLATSNSALLDANVRLVQLNEALQSSNADLETFAYVASHDLQEPLRTIMSCAQLLERSMTGRLDADQQELLDFVVDGARRMGLLIEDVLAYSRVGRGSVEFGVTCLDQSVDWALKNLEQSIGETRAVITRDPLPSVLGDSAQLGQVFQNLIGNALKYRRPDAVPVIHVGASGPGKDEYVISVRDNGLGIAPEYREAVFGAFKRLHGRDVPGTGLGLALCRRIIENHNGRIWLESRPGEGSTFLFSLKAATATAQD